MATMPLGAPPRAPDEVLTSKMGAPSAPEDRPLAVIELPFDMAHLLAPDPIRDTAWQADGACVEVGGDGFFPEKGESVEPAKRVCRRCEVRTDCLDYALANAERFGVWGGMGERERRKLLKGAGRPGMAVAA